MGEKIYQTVITLNAFDFKHRELRLQLNPFAVQTPKGVQTDSAEAEATGVIQYLKKQNKFNNINYQL